jgi:hypothetical protein
VHAFVSLTAILVDRVLAVMESSDARLLTAILGESRQLRSCNLANLDHFGDLVVIAMATGGGIAGTSHAAGLNASNGPSAPQLLTIGY